MAYLPKQVPLISLTDDVLLPGGIKKVPLSSVKNINIFKRLACGSKDASDAIFAVVYDKEDDSVPKIGVAAFLMNKMSDGRQKSTFVTLVGISRIKIKRVETKKDGTTMACVSHIPDSWEDHKDDEELLQLLEEFKGSKALFLDTMNNISTLKKVKGLLDDFSPLFMVDMCASMLAVSVKDKLEVLEAVDPYKRLEKVIGIMKKSKRSASNMKVILATTMPNSSFVKVLDIPRSGISSPKNSDLQRLEDKMKKVQGLPDYALKVVELEMKSLEMMSPYVAEYSLRMNYLDFIASLPWDIRSEENINITKAQEDLDRDHYGLHKIKKRIVEYLAVRLIKNSGAKAPILCFVGPPGVGKTSIGRSIANTMGRKFYRISLGGVCQESEIRGHSRTYVGSMPGRILQAFKSSKVKNPVILLDEVDKLTKGTNGDPTSALLEVLDPEQNCTFVDHFLNMPYDLSETLFIGTANSVSHIPPALRDRMEVIQVSGYTVDEKRNIATQFILPKLLLEHGLPEGCINIPEEMLLRIILRYTQEAGVRSLERKLAAICRHAAVIMAKHIADGSPALQELCIDKSTLTDILGPALYQRSLKPGVGNGVNEPGIAIGLCWSASGGDITVVEASKLQGGSGNLVLTGLLGNVMVESTKLAFNWFRSVAHRLDLCGENEDFLSKCDIHIHFPAGAVSKEGPSAGITTAVALVSLFSGIPVIPDLAMTGEITLSGNVLPVGGIKEKVITAHRADMKKVLLPKKSKAYMDEIPSNVLESIEFIFVTNMDEVIAAAFGGAIVTKKTNNVFISKL